MILCLLGPVKHGAAQVVWEYHGKEIYNYLTRMAQKGLVVFDDNIRPLSRKYLADCLDSLSLKSTRLSAVEQKELAFYLQEYGLEKATPGVSDTIRPRFLKFDPYHRWRSFYAVGQGIVLMADPVFTASTVHGTGKSFNRSSSGLHFWGQAGRHWGFQFFYHDITESGTGIDFLKQGTSEPGYDRRDTTRRKSLNYTPFRGNISYAFRNGSLSVGQDHLLWGYGENGRIVLSDKAPAYPYIRFDYHPFPWLRFNYVHAWLNSNMVDSANTIINPSGAGVFGGVRESYIPKFMATHSLSVKPFKGIELALGESIVYSDRLDVGYLFPLMFFKVYDNIVNNGNINAGSNGQLFAQISSRNNLPKTHLYGSLFIDEIRLSALFDRAKSRNQVGITLGGSVTDVIVPYLTLGLEYTRIQPFVYRNLIPTQNYTSHDYSLGDWMGMNSDRLIYTVKYTPIPKLKCIFRYQSTRKGGDGTIAQQYLIQPQPPFLFDLQRLQKEIYWQVSYEWLNNLSLNAYFSTQKNDDRITLQKTTVTTASIGFTYGL
ncbi:MAG: hypothetical protein JO301_16095 [Chitinophagaceae bacterium]|nr:hypothetical protein [Chitinophagaceae bacterium]